VLILPRAVIERFRFQAIEVFGGEVQFIIFGLYFFEVFQILGTMGGADDFGGDEIPAGKVEDGQRSEAMDKRATVLPAEGHAPGVVGAFAVEPGFGEIQRMGDFSGCDFDLLPGMGWGDGHDIAVGGGSRGIEEAGEHAGAATDEEDGE